MIFRILQSKMSGDLNTSNTKERKNFVKCCMLIVRACRGLMFEIVERTIEPPFQDLTLEQLQSNYKNEEKENLPTLICNLFHDLNDMTPVETDFDISSLHFLMKHFCKSIDRPTNGWGETVEVEVEQIQSEAIEKIPAGDAIEKILSLRSEILKKYGAEAEIPDGDCDRIKRNIESLIKWLENQYGGRKFQDTLGRINADDTAIMERTTYGTTKRQSNERTTINARKGSKMILKEFLRCCETAVDLGDKSICKRDIENAKGRKNLKH